MFLWLFVETSNDSELLSFSAAIEDKQTWSKRLMTQSVANRSEENCADDDKDGDRCTGEWVPLDTAAAAAHFSRSIVCTLLLLLFCITACNGARRQFLYFWKHSMIQCNRPTYCAERRFTGRRIMERICVSCGPMSVCHTLVLWRNGTERIKLVIRYLELSTWHYKGFRASPKK